MDQNNPPESERADAPGGTDDRRAEYTPPTLDTAPEEVLDTLLGTGTGCTDSTDSFCQL